MAAPNVTVNKFETIFINGTSDVSSFFTVLDADGDPVTDYRFSAGSGAGYFELNGNPYAQGATIDITAAQLADLVYVGSTTVANESVVIQAKAGGEWSQAASTVVYTVRDQGTQPIVEAVDFAVLVNEKSALSNYVTAFDPDGWPILKVMVRDRYLDNSYFTLNGTVLPQGQFQTIDYDDLANLEYNSFGNGGSEPIDIFAYDGSTWSERGTVIASRRRNFNAPTVRYTSTNLPVREYLSLSTVLSFNDTDGNSIKSFSLYDSSAHEFSGYLTFNGNQLDAQKWYSFAIEDLNKVGYIGADRTFGEQIAIRASDGRFFSDITRVVVNTVIRPTVVPDKYIQSRQLEELSVAPLFFKTDPGPKHTAFEVIDMTRTPGNVADATGYVFGPGLPRMNDRQVYEFTRNEFDNLSFRTAPYGERVNDEVFARAWNGLLWSSWTRVNVRTESEFDTALPVDQWNNYLNVLPAPSVVTYSFLQAFPTYDSGDATSATFSRFTIDQRRGSRRSFDFLEEFANVTFVEVADSPNAIIRHGNYFDDADGAPAAYAFFPGESEDNPGLSDAAGDIWINTAKMPVFGWGFGSSAARIHMHELGHAMGLKHPHDGLPLLPAETDSTDLTLMSYNTVGNAASMGVYDILSYQLLYGANMSFNTGNDTYGLSWLGAQNFKRTVWDAGGIDTISAVGSLNGANIDLREGILSSIGTGNDNLGIAFGVTIENAVGSANSDTITGNAADNVLRGGIGNDVLAGLDGDDILTGGRGNDTFIFGVGDGSDTIDEQRDAGRDLLQIRDFPDINDLGDVRFRTVNLDLVVEIAIDGGDVQADMTIYRQKWGSYRVESLLIGGGLYIDLTNVYSQATPESQEFKLTNNNSKFGFLVVPV